MTLRMRRTLYSLSCQNVTINYLLGFMLILLSICANLIGDAARKRPLDTQGNVITSFQT